MGAERKEKALKAEDHNFLKDLIERKLGTEKINMMKKLKAELKKLKLSRKLIVEIRTRDL